MLGARLLMGAAEGGVMPISQTLIAAEVKPEHRGLAQGVTQNFGSNLLGSFVAPVLLVAFARPSAGARPSSSPAYPACVAALLLWWLRRASRRSPRAWKRRHTS